MQYTEKELQQLIKSLEVEFSTAFADAEATAQAPLVKAEAPKFPKKEDKAKPEAEETPEEESKETEAKPEAAEAAPADPTKESAPAPAQAPEQVPTPEQTAQASGYDAEEIAHMDQMYMSMSKDELIAHHDSCVRALDAQGTEHTHASQAPQAAAPQAAAPQAPAPEAPAPDFQKSEKMSKSEVVNPETEMLKSENQAQKAKVEELQKNLDIATDFLNKLFKKAPQGKAVTSMEFIAKNDNQKEVSELSKSEVDSILSKKVADPKLQKSDRDAINAFYLNGRNINAISHLLNQGR